MQAKYSHIGVPAKYFFRVKKNVFYTEFFIFPENFFDLPDKKNI